MPQQFIFNIFKVLANWITTTLEHQRIIVKNLQEDLFDGQVLQKLIEHYAKIALKVSILNF